jgi:hypothetical protein
MLAGKGVLEDVAELNQIYNNSSRCSVRNIHKDLGSYNLQTSLEDTIAEGVGNGVWYKTLQSACQNSGGQPELQPSVCHDGFCH